MTLTPSNRFNAASFMTMRVSDVGMDAFESLLGDPEELAEFLNGNDALYFLRALIATNERGQELARRALENFGECESLSEGAVGNLAGCFDPAQRSILLSSDNNNLVSAVAGGMFSTNYDEVIKLFAGMDSAQISAVLTRNNFIVHRFAKKERPGPSTWLKNTIDGLKIEDQAPVFKAWLNSYTVNVLDFYAPDDFLENKLDKFPNPKDKFYVLATGSTFSRLLRNLKNKQTLIDYFNSCANNEQVSILSAKNACAYMAESGYANIAAQTLKKADPKGKRSIFGTYEAASSLIKYRQGRIVDEAFASLDQETKVLICSHLISAQEGADRVLAQQWNRDYRLGV